MDPHSQDPQRQARVGLEGLNALTMEVAQARKFGSPQIIADELHEILAKIPGADDLLKEFRAALPLNAVSSGDAALAEVSLRLQVLRLAIINQRFDCECLTREVAYLKGQLEQRFETKGEPPDEPEEDDGWQPGNDEPWG